MSIGIQAITGLNPKQFLEDPRTCEIVWRNFVKVSSEFADILDKMVRYDCRQRYQSADEALLALNSVPTTAFTAKIEIPLEEPNSDIGVLPTETLFPPDEMPSERGIDYSRLRDLLAKGNWKEADRETKFAILKAVGREEEGRLIVEDIEKLPSSDLCTIDNLWEKYSNGRFGFSVQKRIWENVGGRKDATRDIDYQTWRSFSEQVGWRVNGSWLVSDRLNFTLNAPFGHLPALPNRRWWGLNYHLISHRLGAFGLDDSTKASSNIKQENLIDDLCSERGVDYTQLRDLLAVGNWQEADRETEIIMLRICEREQIGFFKVEDLQNFPCLDLETIDKLWRYYSNGCFGFSIQKNIYDNLVEKQYFQPEIWKIFTERVGWRINSQRISYSNLNFSSNAPKGHLPGWFCEGRDIALILYRRIKDCNIANPVSSKNIISVKSRITVVEGDIIQQKVDAIVNSTDPSFSGIGLLDNAIQREGGSQLREACRQLTICNTGEAKITSGYNLPARWVIHTVSPGWWGDDNNQHEELLAQCYRNCLALAEQYAIKTIALPAIRTGELGFPFEIGCKIAVREVKVFLEKNTSIEKVIFVCFGKSWQKYYDCYLAAIQEILK